MKVVFPVRLDNDVVITGNEAPFMINDAPDYDGESGKDANGDRVTHIVGFNGYDLLKRCTNPNCRRIKPGAEGFGEQGRNSYPKNPMRRDQAQCKECRAPGKK